MKKLLITLIGFILLACSTPESEVATYQLNLKMDSLQTFHRRPSGDLISYYQVAKTPLDTQQIKYFSHHKKSLTFNQKEYSTIGPYIYFKGKGLPNKILTSLNKDTSFRKENDSKFRLPSDRFLWPKSIKKSFMDSTLTDNDSIQEGYLILYQGIFGLGSKKGDTRDSQVY